jgi:hypothetical protein
MYIYFFLKLICKILLQFTALFFPTGQSLREYVGQVPQVLLVTYCTYKKPPAFL